MGHQNPFNGRCIHGKPGVRMEKGAQVCDCRIPATERECKDWNSPEHGELVYVSPPLPDSK